MVKTNGPIHNNLCGDSTLIGMCLISESDRFKDFKKHPESANLRYAQFAERETV